MNVFTSTCRYICDSDVVGMVCWRLSSEVATWADVIPEDYAPRGSYFE